MAIFKLVITFIFSACQLLYPFFGMALNGGIDNLYDEWSPEQEYTADYAVELEKSPYRDFVVLNLADVQLSTEEVFGEKGAMSEALITKAIEEVKPDLITLTGDNSWCFMGYIRLAEFIDSFGIPWAPVMGNHDGDNGDKTEENWDALQMTKCKNCLFKFGPKDMGVGNYVINITEKGKIIHTLYMMDTHTDTSLEVGGYDHLWDNQLDWYEWAVKGTNALAGEPVESSIFFHIPCIQDRQAWADAKYNPSTGKYDAAEYADSFGSNDEGICSPEYDSGFFDLVKELGSTKNIISGHDHVNNSSILYDGVYLNYSLKSGFGSYWQENKLGGSVLTIDSDGHATFGHHFIDMNELEYNDTIDIFQYRLLGKLMSDKLF